RLLLPSRCQDLQEPSRFRQAALRAPARVPRLALGELPVALPLRGQRFGRVGAFAHPESSARSGAQTRAASPPGGARSACPGCSAPAPRAQGRGPPPSGCAAGTSWDTPRPPPSGTRPRGPRAGDTSPASQSSSRTPPARALEVDAVALGALRAQPGLEIHVGLARADVSA